MATILAKRNLHEILFHRSYTRPLSSAATSTISADDLTHKSKPETLPSSLTFNDTKPLFAAVPTSKLLRSSANLHLAAIDPVVDVGTWIMNSQLMEMNAAKNVILGAVKHTFYEHFCGGEDVVALGKSIGKMNDVGLRAMLVYGVEYASNNEDSDKNLDGFLRTVDSARSLPPSSVSFVIVKISAICPLKLLERISHLLRWEYKDSSFNLPWKLKTLPIFSGSSPLYHTSQKPDPLTEEELLHLQLVQERLDKLSRNCARSNLPLSVDAEHTLVQPAIDYFTYSLALIYNKDGQNPIIYATIQTYLKDARDRLRSTVLIAEQMQVPIGFKLVRGAYMTSEKQLASSLGYESPIHDTIQETHDSFNDCASFILEKISTGSFAVVLATHNIESGKLAVEKAKEVGIEKVKKRMEFAQLYGMADSLSFGLRNLGFQVSKYIPYGPVERVIPYLLRRAEENRGLLSTSSLDRQLIRKELRRRLLG